MDRRSFLKKTGVISAGTLLIPSFLRANLFTNGLRLQNKRLVIIQLSGGNDGLNTVVPYGLDEYYKNRTNLGLASKELLKIGDLFGFHPALKGLYDLHQRGVLSVINSVGYPNPSRSHFRSMDIWHTASDSNEYLRSGWLGRYLDNNCEHAYEAIQIDGDMALALKGVEHAGIALTNPKAFYDSINSTFYQSLEAPDSKNEELNYMYRMFNDTRNSAEYIYDQYRLKPNNEVYAKGKLAAKLKEMATLIKSDIQTPIFYTSLSGFDTHANQKFSQQRLLEELNGGITSFVADLEKNGLLKETTIMVFSEFGRRLKENASRGTDHGAANVMFMIDSSLSNAAHGLNQIDLQNLEKGDPKFKVDFRSVYQEVLTNTLGIKAVPVLGRKFDDLNLFV